MPLATDDLLDVPGQYHLRLDVSSATMGGSAFCLCHRPCQSYPTCPDASETAESKELSEHLLAEHALANYEKDHDQNDISLPCTACKPMLAEARRLVFLANFCPGLAPPASQVHPRPPQNLFQPVQSLLACQTD